MIEFTETRRTYVQVENESKAYVLRTVLYLVISVTALFLLTGLAFYGVRRNFLPERVGDALPYLLTVLLFIGAWHFALLEGKTLARENRDEQYTSKLCFFDDPLVFVRDNEAGRVLARTAPTTWSGSPISERTVPSLFLLISKVLSYSPPTKPLRR